MTPIKNSPSSLPPPPADPTLREPAELAELPVQTDQDDFAEPWDPKSPLKLWQQLFRGWPLVILLVVLAGVYAKWRGATDYNHFKQWRARGIAEDAINAAAQGNREQAAKWLDKAAILAPFDAVVMRHMADFCEPQQDIMAIYALRQVAKSGDSTPEDLERLCRLALDWGHPELVYAPSLQEWSAAEPDSLTPVQLRLSAVWLASRGQFQEGGQRLRQALKGAAGTGMAPTLEVALARLLMNAASSAGVAETAAAEPLHLLSGVAYSPSASLALRIESTRLLAGLLLHPSRREMLTPLRADLLRTAFVDLAKETSGKNPVDAANFDLAARTVELAGHPERRGAIVSGLLEYARSATPEIRLQIARWFNDNQFPGDALTLFDEYAGKPVNKDWFTVKVDALYARKSFDDVTALLSSPTQPLPADVQQLFLYRVDRAMGRDGPALDLRRKELEKAIGRAEPREVLSAAENLEKSGDTETALSLFAALKGHQQAGLSARLGMVRCLDSMPDRSGDLLKALESVLQLWPQSDQARNDLAYLRLLDGKPTADDLTIVAELDRQSPWYLSFRISAALAALHRKDPAGALALLERDVVPWERVRPGWQAIYAATLAANSRESEARTIASRLKEVSLRPGEKKLLGK